MFHFIRWSCSLASTALNTKRSSWDPLASLTLGHPTLVLLEKCRTREHFRQILGQMMRIHLITQTFPMSRLLHFSAVLHPENLDMAILLFNHHTPQPNLYIYNTMISALSFSSKQSMALYKNMLQSFIYPDKQTLIFLLKASKCFSEGKQIHSHAIITGFSSYAYLQNSLIKLYSENGRLDLAFQVFQQMPERDVISWNIMISGCSKNGCSLEALELFREMGYSGLKPDEFTMVSLLRACGQLGDARHGKSVHAWIERGKSIWDWNLIVCNSLLDMYVKSEELELAQRVFDEHEERDVISWNIIIAGYANAGEMEIACRLFNQMPCRDLVSWNSLITGYAQKGNCRVLLKLFSDMVAEDVKPDKVTIVGLVCAVAEMGTLSQGRWIHGWVVKSHMKLNSFLGSALIDMYCKCGSIERALKVFERDSDRDVLVWTAMISGLAFHGYGSKALELFWEMHEVVVPNGVTFVAVLTACSHGGMVDQGCRIFNSMKENYSIEPGVEHYGCLVDLLGRAGRLTEAKDVIEKMPMKPSRSIWGAILSACKAHGNVKLAEIALKELLKLEPEKEGGYVLLSNIYASCGRWSYSDRIREIMESRGVKKIAGCSYVVVSGVVHQFVAVDKGHPRWVDIYSILNILNKEMRFGVETSSKLMQHLLFTHLD
ncbi:tetratricopeptide repeat (TPR)-like superfamily protein [Tasmannia lanceolata]|uniref:tetratricopeptide repeat (TPR)-like superfamily protein n=1 Tax=Tasmannia lanceolata TaxID=3420 RepID=UPI0040645CD6